MAILALSCRANSTSPAPETLIRLIVTAAPAPRPALRYQLLPELREMSPGNPIPNYMRCSVEQQGFFLDREALERREDLLAMPLKELAVQELQVHGQVALRQADRAARLDSPRLADPAEAEGRRHRRVDPRRAAAPARGRRPQGAVPRRGGAGPVRRRDPHRQDAVRHVAPPGRAPDVHRQPGGHRGRVQRHRPDGGDAGAAGVPQPLLGPDEPARPLGPPGQGRGRRASCGPRGCSATWTTGPR